MSTWEELKELGNLEYKKQNYSVAITIYTDAIALNCDQDILYSNRALCHKALHNYRQALSDLDKALDITPINTKNLKRKGELLIIYGLIAEAIPYFQKCVNLELKVHQNTMDLLNANSSLTDLNQLRSNFSNENYEKCLELTNKLLLICLGSQEIKIMHIESQIHNNNLPEATLYWSKLSEKERNEDEFVYLICKIFYYEGNYAKATTYLKILLNRVNDNPKYKKLYSTVINVEKEKENANNLFKSGSYEEAIQAYTALLELDSKNKIFNSTIIANRALCRF